MRTIGIGIVGTGFMGKTHTYGYAALPFFFENLPFQVRLVGVCGSSKEKAERFARQYGYQYATDSLGELTADPKINAISLCTPNAMHCDMALRILAAGKHLYLDKPMATTLAEARAMAEAAEKSGVVAQMAMNYRFYPATMRAIELSRQGFLGKILSFRLAYLHSGSVDAGRALGWKTREGGGVLLDLCSHALDLLIAMTGEVDCVQALLQTAYARRPDAQGGIEQVKADDAAYLILRMKSGACGTVEGSKIAAGVEDELRAEIHGDKGAIRFNLLNPNALEIYDLTAPEGTRGFSKVETLNRYAPPSTCFPSPKTPIGFSRGHAQSVFSFVDAISRGAKGCPSFDEGAYLQRVMEAAKLSSEQGCAVRPDQL